jgi:hypothetical protein
VTTPLFDPPAIHELPITRHSDLYVVFNRKVRTGGTDAEPIYEFQDWPAGVTGTLFIDSKEPVALTVDFAGYHAIAWLSYAQAELLRNNTTWAFQVVYPATPNPIRKVPVNGEIRRYDGRQPEERF